MCSRVRLTAEKRFRLLTRGSVVLFRSSGVFEQKANGLPKDDVFCVAWRIPQRLMQSGIPVGAYAGESGLPHTRLHCEDMEVGEDQQVRARKIPFHPPLNP